MNYQNGLRSGLLVWGKLNCFSPKLDGQSNCVYTLQRGSSQLVSYGAAA